MHENAVNYQVFLSPAFLSEARIHYKIQGVFCSVAPCKDAKNIVKYKVVGPFALFDCARNIPKNKAFGLSALCDGANQYDIQEYLPLRPFPRRKYIVKYKVVVGPLAFSEGANIE